MILVDNKESDGRRLRQIGVLCRVKVRQDNSPARIAPNAMSNCFMLIANRAWYIPDSFERSVKGRHSLCGALFAQCLETSQRSKLERLLFPSCVYYFVAHETILGTRCAVAYNLSLERRTNYLRNSIWLGAF